MTQTLTPPGTPPGGYLGVPTCLGLIGRPVGHFLSVSAKSIFFRGKKGKLRGTPSVKRNSSQTERESPDKDDVFSYSMPVSVGGELLSLFTSVGRARGEQ